MAELHKVAQILSQDIPTARRFCENVQAHFSGSIPPYHDILEVLGTNQRTEHSSKAVAAALLQTGRYKRSLVPPVGSIIIASWQKTATHSVPARANAQKPVLAFELAARLGVDLSEAQSFFDAVRGLFKRAAPGMSFILECLDHHPGKKLSAAEVAQVIMKNKRINTFGARVNRSDAYGRRHRIVGPRPDGHLIPDTRAPVSRGGFPPTRKSRIWKPQSDKAVSCPHRQSSRICPLCDPAGYKFEYGDWQSD